MDPPALEINSNNRMVEAPLNGVARALSNGLEEEQVGDYVPKSILLTGGAGFIASHVVIRLCSRYPNTKVISTLQGLGSQLSVFYRSPAVAWSNLHA